MSPSPVPLPKSRYLYKMARLTRSTLAMIVILLVENMVDPFRHKKAPVEDPQTPLRHLDAGSLSMLAVYIEWLARRVFDIGLCALPSSL